MPYAYKYANAVTELGNMGTIKQYITGNIFGTFYRRISFFKQGLNIIDADPN